MVSLLGIYQASVHTSAHSFSMITPVILQSFNCYSSSSPEDSTDLPVLGSYGLKFWPSEQISDSLDKSLLKGVNMYILNLTFQYRLALGNRTIYYKYISSFF